MSGVEERILSLLKDARRELEVVRQRRTEPIAIVGIGCRFPGASTPAEFWRLLRDGVDATSEVPSERWDVASVYDADPEAPGKLYATRGGFLERIDAFDPAFFGISPREAVGMDPQQRLLLEVTWEAIEDAGILPADLKGTATGVWVGLCLDDYARRSMTSGYLERIDPYSALGNARSIAAGRIAYVLDVKGPVIQLDTACSSSLVAVHQACQSLRSGETNVALVGGVNLMSSPEATVALCKLRALSRDGRCKTFDADADGYGRGEGCGMLVLKRLSDARTSGDRIYATIRGTATNHDGRSNGLTAPNGLAQEAVIRAALVNAGLEPSAVDYVEAHGTGTLLGDPIEVLALSRVYAKDRQKGAPLYLGAVKTNIGHLEGAAGIASLIKLALCLDRGFLAAHLHCHRPNSKVPWEALPIQVVTEGRAWQPHTDRTRIGAVSSFGFSGTNAHALLEEAGPVDRQPVAPARAAELIVLSARTPSAVAGAATKLREHLEADSRDSLADIAHGLATTRSLMEHRLAFVAPTRQTLIDALRRAEQGAIPPGGAQGRAPEQPHEVAWLFTGQGAQQLGMGCALYDDWPVFRDALDQILTVIDPLLDRPLRDVMWADPASADAALLDQTAYTQPALFALEWALAQLWRSWAGEPHLLCGHSIGEITAAAVAGVFSPADAAHLVCARGRLMQALPTGGAMVAVAAPELDVARALSGYAGTVSIAAVNGLSSTVIAGAEAVVLELARGFAARGVPIKRLSVSHAFHSPLMDPMLDEFHRVARAVTYQVPRLPIVSNVSGEIAGEEISTPRYWVDHVRRPVRFSSAVQTLYAASVRTFIELGPKPALLGLLPQSVPEAEPLLALPALRPGRSESAAILEALAGWLVAGGSVDWRNVCLNAGRRVRLPTYSWQRQRYWLEDERTTEARAQGSLESALRQLAETGVLSDGARAELPGIVSALEQQRQAARKPGISDWFHALTWRRVSPPAQTQADDRAWVIIGQGPEARTLSDAFGRAGCEREVISDVDSLRSLLGTGGRVGGVVHLLGASEAEREEHRVLAVERTLADSGADVRGWWVTRGAVCTGLDDPPRHPAQAVVWGLGRTFALEHPRTWGGIIDVPGSLSSAEADQIVALLQVRGEDQLALRQPRVFAARLVRQPPVQQRQSAFVTSGTCLVTGGLGGLGLHVARWLARQGVRHLLLVGRHGRLTPGATAAVSELETLGASVSVAAADVTDRVQMTEALAQVPSEAPLTAVFHAAGIVDATPLEALTPARLEEVLAAKRAGTLLLDELTIGRGLQAFVCFSSIAGVWGAGAQAAYAAANAFLDAWAQAARARGCPALAIAWGPWRSQGMASEEALSSLARRGLRALVPELALAALEQALLADLTHAVVVDVDWEKFRVAFEAWGPRALLAEIERPAPVETAHESEGHPVAAELARRPVAARSPYLRAWLLEQCVILLRHEPGTQLDVRRGFFDIGMDSLMLVELRDRLERGIGIRIAPGVFFSHSNIEALAEHLVTELEPKTSSLPEPPPDGPESGETAVLDSDEDVLRFINAKFEGEDDRSGR